MGYECVGVKYEQLRECQTCKIKSSCLRELLHKNSKKRKR